MTLIWDHYPEGGSELLLALALADIADDDGTRIYPGVGFMARKTRMSERNVQYLLGKLLERKILVVERKGGMINGQNYTTRYRMDLGALMALPTQRVQSLHPNTTGGGNLVDNAQEVVQPSVVGGAKQRRKVVKPVAPNTSLSIKNQGGGNIPPESQNQNTEAVCARCRGSLAGGKTLTLNRYVCEQCRQDYLDGKWQRETVTS